MPAALPFFLFVFEVIPVLRLANETTTNRNSFVVGNAPFSTRMIMVRSRGVKGKHISGPATPK
jgi:hypothetical protein